VGKRLFHTLISITILFASSVSLALYNDDNQADYLYQPSPLFNGKAYFSFEGGYAVHFLRLKDAAVTTLVIEEKSRNLDKFFVGAELGFKMDENYEGSPLRFAISAYLRPEKTFDVTNISTNNNTGQISVDTWQVMANIYYDFAGEGFTPFVGLGAGLAVNDSRLIIKNAAEVELSNTRKTETNFAASATAGMAFPLSGGEDASKIIQLAFIARANYIGDIPFNSPAGAVIKSEPTFDIDLGASLIIPLG
jgi:opacity protein-like surface antigen